MRELKLWFFRDLTDDQRLKLFSLFGLPVGEIGNVHGRQSIALDHIADRLAKLVRDEIPAPQNNVVGKVIKRRTMVELLAAVYEHHGWRRNQGESRSKRVQEIYAITADAPNNWFIATPRTPPPQPKTSTSFAKLATELDIDWVSGLFGSAEYGSGEEFLADVAKRLGEPAPQDHVAGIKEWDHRDQEFIRAGESRSYKGRRFVARHDIPADTKTNAPGCSEFWAEERSNG